MTDIAYLVHRFTMAVTSLINASRGNIQCHMTSFFILLSLNGTLVSTFYGVAYPCC